MIWLDLAVICLLSWGAVDGYQRGFRQACWRLGGLLGALLAALLSRSKLKVFGFEKGYMENIIETAVYSRLALPVSGSAGSTVSPPGIPEVLWRSLERGLLPASSGGTTNFVPPLVDLLGCTAGFLAGLLCWWGLFHLAGAALAGKEAGRGDKKSRWWGALLGLARQFCCASIIVGIAVPLAWLCRVPPGLLGVEKTFWGRLAWSLFETFGVWR